MHGVIGTSPVKPSSAAVDVLKSVQDATPRQRIALHQELTGLLSFRRAEPGFDWRTYLVNYKERPGEEILDGDLPSPAQPVLLAELNLIYGWEWKDWPADPSFKTLAPADNQNNLSAASWGWDRLRPGKYRVSINWLPDASFSTAARYTFQDGSENPTTQPVVVMINQQKAPASFKDADGTAWQDIANGVQLNGPYAWVRLDAENQKGTIQGGKARIELIQATGDRPPVRTTTQEWYVKGAPSDISSDWVASYAAQGYTFDQVNEFFSISEDQILACLLQNQGF